MKKKNEHVPIKSEFLLYQTEDGKARIEVRLQDETVWMSQLAMAELFQTTKQNISLHLKNVFEEEELPEKRVVKEYLTTAADSKKYQTKFYNLEAIVVGYRVKSHRGTQFRKWATERLNEYLVVFPTGVGRSGVGSDAKIDIPIAASSVNRFVAPRGSVD